MVTSAPRVLAQHVPYQLILKTAYHVPGSALAVQATNSFAISSLCAAGRQAEALNASSARGRRRIKSDTETIAGEDDDEWHESIDILAVRASTSPAADTSCARTPSFVRTAASAPAPIPARCPPQTRHGPCAHICFYARISVCLQRSTSSRRKNQTVLQQNATPTTKRTMAAALLRLPGISPNCVAPDVPAVSSSPRHPNARKPPNARLWAFRAWWPTASAGSGER